MRLEFRRCEKERERCCFIDIFPLPCDRYRLHIQTNAIFLPRFMVSRLLQITAERFTHAHCVPPFSLSLSLCVFFCLHNLSPIHTRALSLYIHTLVTLQHPRTDTVRECTNDTPTSLTCLVLVHPLINCVHAFKLCQIDDAMWISACTCVHIYA